MVGCAANAGTLLTALHVDFDGYVISTDRRGMASRSCRMPKAAFRVAASIVPHL
jgi:hypothetical protein